MAIPMDAAAVRDAVAQYLRAAGMPEVAAALRPHPLPEDDEDDVDGDDAPVPTGPTPTGLIPTEPIPASPRTALSTTALTLLLTPHAAARASVARLMRGGDEALLRQFYSEHQPPPPRAACLALLRALREPMWSAQCDADDARIPAPRGADLFTVPAATFCQLVAHLTHVCVFTLASPGEAHVRAQDRFMRAFLRQHRNFALSRALLARLLERFLVPQHSMTFGFEHFAAHGVAVHAPGALVETKRSASLCLRVCRAVQVRVLSVLTHWLRLHPQHFDSLMLEVIGVFLDDCCYRPQAWADCPSQLAQLAEFVRAEAVHAAIANKNRDTDTSDSYRTESVRCSVGHNPMSDPSHESSRAVLCFSAAFPMSRVAAALTARDLCLLAEVRVAELLDVGRSARMASALPERGLIALFARGAELCAWAVSALLHAARDSVEAFGSMLQRLVDLTVALLRVNNVHSAIAVNRALRHPLPQRVARHEVVLAALPASALESIARVAEAFDLLGPHTAAPGAMRAAHDIYVRGIPDADVHPTVPALQWHVRELRQLHAEVPTFLHVPGGTLDGKESIIAVNWKKFRLADEIIERILAWRAAAEAAAVNMTRDVEFEKAFAQQATHIVHDPRYLARMANELLTTL